MDPEFLPEFFLLIAGLFLGVFAIHLLAGRQWGRAVRIGAASIVSISLAFLLGNSDCLRWKYSKPWYLHYSEERAALAPGDDSVYDEKSSGARPSMSLLLGGVLVRVAASDQYVLAIEDEAFLTMDLIPPGLLVTCAVAGSSNFPTRVPEVAASIRGSSVMFRGPDVRAIRPDRHTMIVQEHGKDVLRVRYAGPRTIEVSGQLYLSNNSPEVVSLAEGISWRGVGVPSGATIDLRPQGKGTIRFKRSGLIEVVPGHD
jgi:hypothetical protein